MKSAFQISRSAWLFALKKTLDNIRVYEPGRTQVAASSLPCQHLQLLSPIHSCKGQSIFPVMFRS
jgi:hypothetical protein